MKVLIFDTETTGLPKERNPSIYDTQKWPHIIQLSYIVYDNETNDIITVEDDYIHISDDVVIEPDSQKIHNISREMLIDKGISIEQALEKFNKFSEKTSALKSSKTLGLEQMWRFFQIQMFDSLSATNFRRKLSRSNTTP